MPSNRSTLMTVLALLLIAAGAALPAAAESVPSSDLLLPWFEVHLSGQRTTLFAVGNAAGEPVDVRVSVHTNWGIPVVERIIRLKADEVQTVNLRDWLVAGNVPAPRLRGAELKHVQAALTGQPSPKDDLFYSTQADPFDPELAAGYVTLRIKGTQRPQALWGDYFWVDPEQDFAEGELLVNINKTADCGDLCDTHRMRFIDGGGFDGGTKLVIWSGKQLQPAPNANAATLRDLLSLSAFHREPGEQFDERVLELLPVELVSVKDLFLDERFGWMDLASDEEIYVGVRYSANNRYSVAFQTWCIPEPPLPPPPPSEATPELDLEKLTNDQDADLPPGPTVQGGGSVTWKYVVTNTGSVRVTDIEVTDDKEGTIACPKTALDPGQSMTCTLSGTAPAAASAAFFYDNLGTVTGKDPSGEPVSDDDPSHYRVPPQVVTPPAIDIEKATNGQDADQAPGPSIQQGGAVTWTYVVTNTGQVTLTGVAVTDDKEGAVACPKATLAVGESMTCTKNGTAQLGQYANLGSVTGTPQGGGSPVSDSDPSHYNGTAQPVPAIDIEKATNGQDADQAPGPSIQEGNAVTWTYVVTNTGQVALTGVSVSDNQEGAISCPKSTLAAGESMTCTENGTAQLGQYANVGSVTGTPQGGGTSVSDSDPSHYNGTAQPVPAIDIEKATNGQDADQAPGPSILEGGAVTWTYVVTNSGQVKLNGIAVTDNKEGAVACPKASLAVGESMTCTKNGTAQLGQYANVGSVTGTPQGGGSPVSDSDPSHYNGTPKPASIDIEKATNGQDADTGLGPELEVGQAVTWTYVVTNTGEAKLTNVAVSDDKEGAVACPKSTLQPGESMTCTKNGIAVEGNYANLGTVTGKRFGDGFQVSDSDPSHYHAEPPPPCGACEGKVTRLTLRYLGGIAGAHVQVYAKRGPSNDVVFDGTVSPGGTFEVVGPAGGGGFGGTLGTEVRFKVNGIDNATMHTSCSQPIGPGLVSGDFLVLEGESSGGGLLCPLN